MARITGRLAADRPTQPRVITGKCWLIGPLIGVFLLPPGKPESLFHPSYIFLYWLSMSQKKWGTNKSDPAKSAFFQGVGWNSYLLVIWAFIAAVIRNSCSPLAGLKSLKTHKQIEPKGDWGSHLYERNWWSILMIESIRLNDMPITAPLECL